MSDDIQQVVELTLRDPAVAAERGAAVQDWLRAKGVLAEPRDDPHFGGAFAPGPAAPTVAPGFDDWDVSGVDVSTHWQLISGFEAEDDSVCPVCEEVLDDEEFSTVIQAWQPTEPEPTVTCAACGHATPVNEVRGNVTTATHLAVGFWNWPPLDETFLAELAAQLGSRTKQIYAHI